MTTTMKRIFLNGIKNAELRNIAAKEIGRMDARVTVKACGICGSDLGFYKMGKLAPQAPVFEFPLGHEFSGVISEVGEDVTGLSVGDRVSVNPSTGGDIGFGGPEGGFSSNVVVQNAKKDVNVFQIPDSVPFDIAALLEPLNVAYQCVLRSDPLEGQKIVVFGAGPIGLATLVCLVERGFRDVVICDLSEYRLQLAAQLGAETTLNVGQVNVWETLKELHGQTEHFGQSFADTDLFIEASGAPIIEDLIRESKFGARITFVAASKTPATVDFTQIMAKQLDVLGSQMYPSDFSAPLPILQNVDLTPMISHKFQLGEFKEAIHTASDSSSAAKVMIEM